MGNKNNKVAPLSLTLVVQRLNDCLIPDDREKILDFLELIDIGLTVKDEKAASKAAKQLKDADGVLLIIKLMKRLIDDQAFLQGAVTIFSNIKRNMPLIMDFIQFGGLDVLDKVIRLHSKDEYLAKMTPKVLKTVLVIGAAASIEEIRNEGLNLRLCQSCQETIERAKKTQYSVTNTKIPKSSDRAMKVLRFMDNYMTRIDVQCVAMDALLNFVNNSDGPVQVKDTNLIIVMCRSLNEHPRDDNIIWRTSFILSKVAGFNEELALDILSFMVHDTLSENYDFFSNQQLVQQQILWLLSSFLQWPRSSKVAQKSGTFMNFLKVLVETKEQEINSIDRTNQEEAKKLEAKVFEVVIPVRLRTFLRETKGKRLKEKEVAPVRTTFQQRRNFDEKPKFGTVDTAIFVKGEEGLIGGPDDDKEIEPEWEKALTYGKPKAAAKFKK